MRQETQKKMPFEANGRPSELFADRLNKRIIQVNSRVCVGLDPDLSKFPSALLAEYGLRDFQSTPFSRLDLQNVSACIVKFAKAVIDATYDLAAVVKPQCAFFERYGQHGIAALEETVVHAASRGLLVIMDGKRNDIGSTATQYALAYLGYDDNANGSVTPCDAMTINPYLGSDGVLPFVRSCETRGTGVFVLVKTSNPSSGEFQDLRLETGETLALRVARMVDTWGQSTINADGFSSVGAVMGATYPEDIKIMRGIMPAAIFLIPGYGAQGATASEISAAFNSQGLGAIVNASRSILYPYDPKAADFVAAIRESALLMKEDINRHIA